MQNRSQKGAGTKMHKCLVEMGLGTAMVNEIKYAENDILCVLVHQSTSWGIYHFYISL